MQFLSKCFIFSKSIYRVPYFHIKTQQQCAKEKSTKLRHRKGSGIWYTPKCVGVGALACGVWCSQVRYSLLCSILSLYLSPLYYICLGLIPMAWLAPFY